MALDFRCSGWTYDQEVGYRYKPDQVWMGGLVQNGRLLGCNSQSRTDARGNMGSSGAGYDDAEVKVLGFGDSVKAQPTDNVTYPLLLERALSERVGQRVSVMNFRRDRRGATRSVWATANATSVKPALWDLDYSLVAETILHGDPFAFVLWKEVAAKMSQRSNINAAVLPKSFVRYNLRTITIRQTRDDVAAQEPR
jgi:hypothetical protein